MHRIDETRQIANKQPGNDRKGQYHRGGGCEPYRFMMISCGLYVYKTSVGKGYDTYSRGHSGLRLTGE